MDKNTSILTEVVSSSNSTNLVVLINKLNNIISDLSNKKQINIIINQLQNVVKVLTDIMNTNNLNSEKLSQVLNNLKYQGSSSNTNFKSPNNIEFKSIKFENGDRYEGTFKNMKMEGKGIYYYSTGDRYEGDFKNDKFDGKGIYYFSNGNRYEGDYKNDERIGQGTFYYNNGDRSMGNYICIDMSLQEE